jgi:hypothetical protein
MSDRFELWSFDGSAPTYVGRFATRRLAYRIALRLRLRSYQVRPAAEVVSL